MIMHVNISMHSILQDEKNPLVLQYDIKEDILIIPLPRKENTPKKSIQMFEDPKNNNMMNKNDLHFGKYSYHFKL